MQPRTPMMPRVMHRLHYIIKFEINFGRSARAQCIPKRMSFFIRLISHCCHGNCWRGCCVLLLPCSHIYVTREDFATRYPQSQTLNISLSSSLVDDFHVHRTCDCLSMSESEINVGHLSLACLTYLLENHKRCDINN